MDKLLKDTNLAFVIGTHSWREQFIDAVTVNAGQFFFSLLLFLVLQSIIMCRICEINKILIKSMAVHLSLTNSWNLRFKLNITLSKDIYTMTEDHLIWLILNLSSLNRWWRWPRGTGAANAKLLWLFHAHIVRFLENSVCLHSTHGVLEWMGMLYRFNLCHWFLNSHYWRPCFPFWLHCRP